MTLTGSLVSRALAIIAVICAIGAGQQQALATSKIGCFDEDGNAVDWYMGYKFPKLKTDKKFDTGEAYAYITNLDVAEGPNEDLKTNRKVERPDSLTFLRRFKDLLMKFGGPFSRSTNHSPSDSTSGSTQSRPRSRESIRESQWVASDLIISDPKSIFMRTLQPAYDKKLFDSISSVYYNDDSDSTSASEENSDDEDETSTVTLRRQSSSRRNSSRTAHAKGVILMDEKANTGVWLTHSIPRFPNTRDHALDYPKNGQIYGQTFMCVTFDVRKYGANLTNHLINMRPNVYDMKVSDSLLALIPQLQYLEPHQRRVRSRAPKSPSFLSQTITSQGGQVLNLYSKAASLKEDLYKDLISKELNSDLYAETWRRSRGTPLNSSCESTEHHVNNVLELKYSDDLQWAYSLDHSKWAITEEEQSGYVCIADANRMLSQYKRGSGAVCLRCPTCWSLFKNTIQEIESCPVPPKKGVKIDDSLARRIEAYIKATGQ